MCPEYIDKTYNVGDFHVTPTCHKDLSIIMGLIESQEKQKNILSVLGHLYTLDLLYKNI